MLTKLATAEHVGTVVLNSSEMPPADAGTVFQPDDAVTSLRVAGLPMNVLLSDDTLTGVLKAGDTSSGSLPKATEFAVRQRFLAETAMIAAEEPNSARDHRGGAAGGLEPVGDAGQRPARRDHEHPVADADPAGQPELGAGHPAHGAPAAAAGQQGEPGRAQPQLPGPGALGRRPAQRVQIHALQARAGLRAGTGSGPGRHRVGGLARRRERRRAWRRLDNLSDYLSSAEKKVRIITASSQVPMGGSSGLVPVSIQNGLLLQAIQVKVVASVAATSQLTIGHFQNLIIVPPGQVVTVRLPVSSAPQGSTEIQISLTSADGRPLTFVRGNSLTVQSTRYGRAILVLIAAAIGVLVLTSVYRGVRRWLDGDTQLVNEEADPPGSVVTGTSDALHPTEAPDDLADARRWVDDA